MSDVIHLEIVTPRGRALLVDADEVTAPSIQGEFGVLPGHVPVLAALRTGIVTYRTRGESHRCVVGSGFAEAGPDKLVILTTEYAERDQIDPVLIRKDLSEIQSQLAKLEGVLLVGSDAKGADAAAVEAKAQRDALIARENWLAAQLDLYGDPLPATQRPYDEFAPPSPATDDVSAVGDPDAPQPGGAA